MHACAVRVGSQIAQLPVFALRGNFTAESGPPSQLTCTLPSSDAAALAIRTCGDSFGTLSEYFTEVSDALGGREVAESSDEAALALAAQHSRAGSQTAQAKPPAAPQHRSAVFADSQAAWIALPEPEPESQLPHSVQMEPFQWNETPVVTDDYVPRAPDPQVHVAELRQSESVDSAGFVDLGEDFGCPTPPIRRPVGMSQPGQADDEQSADVPQRAVLFEPEKLQNLMESYMHFSAPEQTQDEQQAVPEDVTEGSANLRVLFTCPGVLVWHLHDGHDWAEGSGIGSRGTVHVEARFGDTRCLTLTYSAAEDMQKIRHTQVYSETCGPCKFTCADEVCLLC
jgi:hypothetical protein